MESLIEIYHTFKTMNFYSIRWILLVIILLPLIMKIIKKIKESKVSNESDKIESTLSKKELVIGKIILLVIVALIFISIPEIYFGFAFEKYFLKFNSIDKTFNYYYPNEKIEKKIKVNKKYTIVLSKTNGYDGLDMRYFVKEGKKWNIENMRDRGNPKKIQSPFSLTFDPTYAFKISTFEIINFKSIEKTYIFFCTTSDEKNEEIEPYDSEKSDFIKIHKPFSGYIYNYYLFEVNKNIDNDYTIYYNGNKYSGFIKK